MTQYKVNEEIWQELMYYINNLYDVAVYTKGRDIYPDRVTFARNLDAEQVLESKGGKNIEYVTLNARSKEKSLRAIKERRIRAERVITDSIFVNNMLNCGKAENEKKDYSALFDYVKSRLTVAETANFEKLNAFILNAYKKLSLQDALKIASFRENAINKCVNNGLISSEFADYQKELFPNSSIKLQAMNV